MSELQSTGISVLRSSDIPFMTFNSYLFVFKANSYLLTTAKVIFSSILLETLYKHTISLLPRYHIRIIMNLLKEG